MNPLWLAALLPTVASLASFLVLYGTLIQKATDTARRVDVIEPELRDHGKRIAKLEGHEPQEAQ